MYEILRSSDAFHYLAHEVCDDKHPLTEQVCAYIFEDYLGINQDQLNVSMISFYLDHLPAGTSTETFVHYAQLYVKGNDAFDRYDWGPEENVIRYGQAEPPAMDFSLITTPTALFVGDADDLACVADNEVLASRLPNLLGNHLVDYEGWTHGDFVMAMDADTLVYSKILDYMSQLNI